MLVLFGVMVLCGLDFAVWWFDFVGGWARCGIRVCGLCNIDSGCGFAVSGSGVLAGIWGVLVVGVDCLFWVELFVIWIVCFGWVCLWLDILAGVVG